MFLFKREEAGKAQEAGKDLLDGKARGAEKDLSGDKMGEAQGETQGETTGTWIVYNRGTALEFSECSQCGYEDNENLFALLEDGSRRAQAKCRCPKCGLLILDWEDAVEE